MTNPPRRTVRAPKSSLPPTVPAQDGEDQKLLSPADIRAARKAARQAERTARQAEARARREAEREARRSARATQDQPAERAQPETGPLAAEAPPAPVAAAPQADAGVKPRREPKPRASGPAKALPKTVRKARGEAAVRTRPAATKQAASRGASQKFNILAVAQAGRLECEALLLAASLRVSAPDFSGRLIIAEPRSEGAWAGHHTELSAWTRPAFAAFGAEVMPFTATVFGAAYPHGNKIEALSLLPAGEPFMFLDSDSIVTGPIDRQAIDMQRPSASMRREGTWPVAPLYGPGLGDIWRAVYDRFGLSVDDTLDLRHPDEHWERYLYFNAGWFFGADPQAFHDRFLPWAQALSTDPGEVLAAQVLDPWLDQIILPLVIHALGGGRPLDDAAGLDNGDVLWHYRSLPLLYATAPDRVVNALEASLARAELAPLLTEWESARRMVAEGEGRTRVRPLFDRARLPSREQAIRQRLKVEGLWLR